MHIAGLDGVQGDLHSQVDAAAFDHFPRTSGLGPCKDRLVPCSLALQPQWKKTYRVYRVL